jgi:hypothetical protein
MKIQKYLEKLEQHLKILQKPKFFIVGCQKSGSSWLQYMLDAHPELCCCGEGKFIEELLLPLNAMVDNYNQKQTVGNHNVFDNSDREYILTTLITMLFNKWEKAGDEKVKYLGDRSPGNAIVMDAINELFPDCKFIHMIRDGRDVAVSGWFHNLREPSPLFTQQFAGDFHAYALHSCLYHWRHYIIKARIFGKKHPEQYFELRYEDLKRNPEPIVKDMLDFLEVNSSSEILKSCLEAGSFEKLSGGRKPGEEDLNSPFRKGIVGDWRNHFDIELSDAYYEEGKTMLKELKYI